MATATRSGSGGASASPESAQASVAAITACWEERSSRPRPHPFQDVGRFDAHLCGDPHRQLLGPRVLEYAHP
jgi:hypothetical protein